MTLSPYFFFDAGLTLITPFPSIGFHYALFAKKYGVQAEEKPLETGFYAAWKEHSARHTPSMGPPYGTTHQQALRFWTQIIKDTFKAAQTELPSDPSFPKALYDHFEKKECWKLAPDALQVFHSLEQKGIPFGILSNWDLRLRRIFHNLGIAHRFFPLVVSAEEGLEKPQPEFFLRAEQKAGASTNTRFILIGNDEINDGQGAKSAGWDVCLIRKGRLPQSSPEIPRVTTLTEAISHYLD
jgi:putative hydrolase of the HAD superfamily